MDREEPGVVGSEREPIVYMKLQIKTKIKITN